jgi:hypothetical protein
MSQMKIYVKIITVLFICLLACISVASAGDYIPPQPWPITENGITGCWTVGNPTCSDLGCGTQFKVETEGTYTNEWCLSFGNCISIEAITESDGAETKEVGINWTSDFPVNCVFMKASPGGYLYCYENPSKGDNFLYTAKVKDTDNRHEISHILFCYDPSEIYPPPEVPEFPSVAVPVALIIGIGGLVFLVRSREQ